MSLTKNNMTPIPRKDLADFPAGDKPIGFIGDLVFPPLKRAALNGTLYYQAYADFDTATTGRASGGTVTGLQVSNSNTTFSNAEVLARIQTDEKEIELLGGPDAAEKVLALRGHRSLFKNIEAKQVAQVGFGSASDIHTAIYDGIVAAVAAMKPKLQGHVGRLALVGGSTAFNVLRNETTVKDRMKAIGAPVDSMTRQITMSALAEVFQVRECHEGIDGFWPTYGVALAYLPDPNEDPTVSAQLGRTIFYDFDGQGGLVKCEEGYDPAKRSNYLDFTSYLQVLPLNTDFITALRIVAST